MVRPIVDIVLCNLHLFLLGNARKPNFVNQMIWLLIVELLIKKYRLMYLFHVGYTSIDLQIYFKNLISLTLSLFLGNFNEKLMVLFILTKNHIFTLKNQFW